MDFKFGQGVKHKTKRLYEARFVGWSKSGKRVAVKHNAYAPWGVCMVVDYYAPKNIEVS